jgi:pimeloyl-ACP methyl ester carboxylesterase
MERLRLRARGLVFGVLAAGPLRGDPVVLLHGFPQTAACWIRVAETLAAVGYRVLAPDQRGYSPGARPVAMRAYRMPELVADVLAQAERPGRPGPSGRARLGRRGRLGSGRPAPGSGGNPDLGVDASPAGFRGGASCARGWSLELEAGAGRAGPAEDRLGLWEPLGLHCDLRLRPQRGRNMQ